MRLIIAAIGKLKSGAERDLVARYLDRINKTGKAIGITKTEMIELPESRLTNVDGRKNEEAEAVLARLPADSVIFCFDERGKSPTSIEFAKAVQQSATNGAPALVMIIGGPDGLASSLRKTADRTISFGSLTMPHQLARVLVAEQVYRAVTILTNHPYHRE